MVGQFETDVDYANKLRIRPFEQRLNPEKKLNLSLQRLLVVVVESAVDCRHLCFPSRIAMKKAFEHAFYPLWPDKVKLINRVLAQDLDIFSNTAEVSERRTWYADQARSW